MAFIREYAAAGDPFSLRMPKRLRKMKVGRALGRIGKAVIPFAGMIPGVGGLLSPFMRKLQGIASKYGVSPQLATEFARSYGLDVGDVDDDDDDGEDFGSYMGDPGAPRPQRKRKSAGAGPAAKAKKKKAVRKDRAKRTNAQGKPIDWGKLGEAATSLLPVGADLAKEIGAQFGGKKVGVNPEEAALGEMMAAMGGKRTGAGRAMAFGRKRRAMNPANTRALSRSMRRVEGFQKLVKRMHKQFPTLRGAAARPMGAARHYSRGHKSGCGCVVCKRAA